MFEDTVSEETVAIYTGLYVNAVVGLKLEKAMTHIRRDIKMAKNLYEMWALLLAIYRLYAAEWCKLKVVNLSMFGHGQ